MRGQPENPLDIGIGKKVEPKTEKADPWVKGSRPGTYRNTETGKTETRIPGNEAANQQPVEPEPTGVFDADFFRRHGLIWSGFYPLG